MLLRFQILLLRTIGALRIHNLLVSAFRVHVICAKHGQSHRLKATSPYSILSLPNRSLISRMLAISELFLENRMTGQSDLPEASRNEGVVPAWHNHWTTLCSVSYRFWLETSPILWPVTVLGVLSQRTATRLINELKVITSLRIFIAVILLLLRYGHQ